MADLSGVWRAAPDPEAMKIPGGGDINFAPRYMISIAGGFSPGPLPLQPWAAKLFRARGERFLKDQPTSACKPLGTPQRDSWSLPFKIVQTPTLLLLLYEMDKVYRQVFLDGRSLPTDPQPSSLGYSVGRWEGNTLLVETNGFQDKGWLDLMGHPHSDALRMEERFRRSDSGHLDITVTQAKCSRWTRWMRLAGPPPPAPSSTSTVNHGISRALDVRAPNRRADWMARQRKSCASAPAAGGRDSSGIWLRGRMNWSWRQRNSRPMAAACSTVSRWRSNKPESETNKREK
jgi:hypothetical protein